MVCFIHRPEYYHLYNDEKTGKDLRGLGQIIVAKHRNGATDEVWLRFVDKYARFQNESDAFDDLPQATATRQVASRMNSLPSPDADGAILDKGEDFEAPF